MSPIDPITALTAVGTGLKIIDSLTGQWDRFFRNKRSEAGVVTPHRVTATQEAPDKIVIRDRGNQVETITAADLAELDPNSRALIKALEDSMQRQFDLWVAVYPRRDASPDPVVNAQIDRQLTDIARKMCGDLKTLFGYLGRLGKQLEDHYQHARYICDDLAAGRLSGPAA